MEKKKSKNSTFIKIIYTFAVITGLLTIGAFFYPRIADAWNRYVASKLVSEYTYQASDATVDYTDEWEKLYKYNRKLFKKGPNNIPEYTQRLSGDTSTDMTEGTKLSGTVLNPDEYYESILNVNDNGIMAYVEIPKIDVSLPIFHYTSEDVLSEGAGHLYGTSLPGGGKSAHCVITGHSGLMKARIFSDLERLEVGDLFSIYVLEKKLNYKVDQIKAVLPNEVEDLSIEKGKDMVTLLTCTPYGINTHRLLVRGSRIEDDEAEKIVTTYEEEKDTASQVQDIIRFPITIFALCILVIILGIIIIIMIWRDKK